jgi:hypothetical protein
VTRLLPLNPTGTVTVSVTDREGLSDSAEFIVG